MVADAIVHVFYIARKRKNPARKRSSDGLGRIRTSAILTLHGALSINDKNQQNAAEFDARNPQEQRMSLFEIGNSGFVELPSLSKIESKKNSIEGIPTKIISDLNDQRDIAECNAQGNKQIEPEGKKDQENNDCIICLEARSEMVFVECGHGGLCKKCAFLHW
eukprot:CAMPEP_0176472340 /NCGR_PEP_ID=MMETSP0127-20121128/41690_1 /TAXON_ID=938130 /ORGANISM="Platyophrya macrostoma, Strain WH" /LENGTH=162 /DNA_ID=CAMNT_0017867201 /DNA_START=39 /DNA_END=524 /DNA_ORIENTATION=+